MKGATMGFDTQTLEEHQKHLPEHLRHVQTSGRPLFVTEQGKTTAVVLSPTAYEDLVNKALLTQTLYDIDRSLEDIAAGRVQDAREAMHEIAEQHGLTLGR